MILYSFVMYTAMIDSKPRLNNEEDKELDDELEMAIGQYWKRM
jgi:hypothetical protein